MAGINFNTSNQTFRQLMGNGLFYKVPRFQRDYSWSDEYWDDLWQDMLGCLEIGGEPVHYMGYLVLQTQDTKSFDIIDGQQRITTLSLIVLAVLKNLQDLEEKEIDKNNNAIRREQLRNSYIGYLDPVTLVSQSKITLNRNNNDFYQTYLVPLRNSAIHGLKASERLMSSGFKWYYEKIKQQFGKNQNGADLASFLDRIADKLVFTVISVDDELNAFKVFETLNARGVRLSATDLLKNHLFSVVSSEGSHETELSSLESQWERIVGKLGSEDFPTFLRFYWNSQNKLIRKNDLYKTIRSKVKSKKDVFSLIRDLDAKADIYAALKNPFDEKWTSGQKNYVMELKMYSVTQPFPLLMSAYGKINEQDYEKLLRACSIISFRYNVISSLNANDQELTYNKVSVAITNGEIKSLRDIISGLNSIYPQDDSFRTAFENKELKTTSTRNNKIVRYILFQIEKHCSNNDYDFQSEKYSIEHILPENPNDDWNSFEERLQEHYIYRLGNYTLLDKSVNRDIGIQRYTEKLIIYKTSPFLITKNISEEYNEWIPESVIRRQQWMARQATAIWRIENL